MLFKDIVYSNIQNGRHVATTVRSSVTEPGDWAACGKSSHFGFVGGFLQSNQLAHHVTYTTLCYIGLG